MGLPALTPAHADFYDLKGRYECLADPEKTCYDAVPSPPDAPPPADLDIPVPVAPPSEHKEAKTPSAADKPAEPPKPPADPMTEIAGRLQQHKPEDGDIILLVARARDGDPRAFEMLAWCSLTGTGVPRDPVRAYVLYGRAAALGARTGRESQALVFKRALSQDQRQQVLEMENGRRPGE
jgi:hypothetical protein